MDDLEVLRKFLQDELDARKENFSRGIYREQDIYFGVLGECKIIITMIKQIDGMLAQRIMEEDDD